MARRNRSRRSNQNNGLIVHFSGPPGCGKTTAMQAFRLLLQDAGGRAEFGVRGGLDHDGELNLVIAKLDPAALAELGEWMADEPA